MRHLTAGAGLGLALLLAGCTAGPASASRPASTKVIATAGASCGSVRTAVNVRVTVKVTRGSVDCPAALRVEQAFAAAIASGHLRGNGGGAPVPVDGWTCEAYPAEQALRTGRASECHTASAEVVAVLAVPSGASATSTDS